MTNLIRVFFDAVIKDKLCKDFYGEAARVSSEGIEEIKDCKSELQDVPYHMHKQIRIVWTPEPEN